MISVRCDRAGCDRPVEHGLHHKHVFSLADGISPVIWEGHLCSRCVSEVLEHLKFHNESARPRTNIIEPIDDFTKCGSSR